MSVSMCKEDILHNFFLAMRKYCVRLHQMVIASNYNCKFLHYTDYFHIQIICYIMSIYALMKYQINFFE